MGSPGSAGIFYKFYFGTFAGFYNCFCYMRYKTLLIIAIASLYCTGIRAQNQKFRFSRFDINQGLSHNYINAIIKDGQGFLWIGSISGLNRYDGYTFRVFKHDSRDTSSISDDYIEQLMEGPENKLWVGTRNGFNVYDPLTGKFDHHIRKYLDEFHIAADTIFNIIKDAEGNFWFLSDTSGLFKFMPSIHKTIHFNYIRGEDSSISTNVVSSICQESGSDYWLIHKNGILEKMSARTGKIVKRSSVLKNTYPGESIDYRLYMDRQNDIWIYATANTAKGVFYYNTQSGIFRHISKADGVAHLNTDIVNGILQDEEGLIWIATDHGGVNLIDKNDFSIGYLLNQEGDNQSISQNSINVIYKDNANIIWIGTFKKGVSYYHREATRFPLYQHHPSDKNSLSYSDENCFVEDSKSNLWIGANGGGLIYFDRTKGIFKQYLHNPADPNSLCNDVIVSLMLDHEQKLWIGTYYGGLDCYDGTRFIHYRHKETDANSIADDRIWSLKEDSRQRFWVGTFEGGLDLYDRKKNIFTHHKTGNNSVHSSYITAIEEDRAGNIWLATSYGLDVIDQETGNFSYYMHDDSKPDSTLSNNNVISIKQDSRGNMWAGTRVGLDLFDPRTNTFRTFRVEDGLPDNLILNILEDNNHNLWLSTPAGISNMIITGDPSSDRFSYRFKNYDESDGLQGKAFNEKAALKTKAGEMIFGGADGFNIFNPTLILPDAGNMPLVLTELQVFNKKVNAGEKQNGHIILSQAIEQAKEIVLKYNENIFSIEFAALNFSAPEKIKYEYKLVGFNNEWLAADNKIRKATYTNLDPGDYTLVVRAANSDGVWSNQQASVAIKILPPFWKTYWAYLIYGIFICSLLYLARHMILQRAGMRFAIEQERKEAQRLHDLDMMKIRFFTNVSHEFRTPLSLILTPLDKLIKYASDLSQKRQFEMIHRNARRLLNLVNQLLDFRKMEGEELKLSPLRGDIVVFIKEISYSFTDLAEKEHIAFSFSSSIDHFYTRFDHDKMERILFNLLSNAFKFTPGNGKVSVELNKTKRGEANIMEIKVCDTGIGMPPEKQERIFERFFQNELPANMLNQGSGIGLSITREFVKLHQGSISVVSKVDQGSCFLVSLPLEELETDIEETQADREEPVLSEPDGYNNNEVSMPSVYGKEKNRSAKKPAILLVEDNEDLRFYLKDNLKQYFNIVEAPNGKIGWQKALAIHPDLIVSDIAMPEMNGIDLCRKLKNDTRTSFIPVILLTALTGEEKQLKGLETGASDYMTKPFNFEILLSKIRNQLTQQETIKRTYQKQVIAEPSEIQVDSPDERFMQHALEFVEKNISNPGLSVKGLSREMFMSRVGLYKKLLALTGKTPVEFIRSIRLKRSAQLLEKSKLTVAEIAYEVGFNNPKYFSKSFKSAFNMLPSAYQEEKRKEQFEEETADPGRLV
jgi:signal transduction histidine kinase/ligand-binding sensor domain-containing protein/DNA-binding response OmpR family regulator